MTFKACKATVQLVALFQFASFYISGQEKISFGKASLEDLQMTTYEADTTAEAVVLSDIGKLDGNLKFTRHIRVKILKKSGLSWGNWIFNTPSKGDFKVNVFNLSNGEIVKEKIDGNAIYAEEVIDNFEIYKVFAPNVKVGSVIDIFYTFYGLPFEWRFQERIPVLYSDLIMETSRYIRYSKTFFGFEDIQTISPDHWRAENMPAFRTEPLINTYQNYITKFEFQIAGFAQATSVGYNRQVRYMELTTWKNIIQFLIESSSFGKLSDYSLFLKDKATEIKKKEISDEEKVNEAYAYIRDNIKWNNVNGIFAPISKLKEHFEVTHSGNCAEVNLLLISLLNRIGITTYPVVLSTRDNGLIVPHSPSFSKLNYVVAYVEHGDLSLYLDATSEHVKPGILPTHCLNGQGLLIVKDREQWLTLNTKYSDSKRQYSEITISADGQVQAKLNQDYQDYGFVNWMDELKANNQNLGAVKNKYQNSNPDIKIDHYEIKKKDVAKLTGQEYLEINMANAMVDAGDEFILNPFVLFDYNKNPFQSESRKYPVDLAHPKDLTTTIIISLPESLSVAQLPTSQKIKTPDGGAQFSFTVSASNRKIVIRTTVKLTKQIYTEGEYPDLRNFYSEVIKTINSPIQLSKKT